jgi:poly(ADP-ribose) glycohydrolase
MIGYGRNAELASIVPVDATTPHDWSARTMLFMDALALDGYDTSTSTPDLLPGNVDRELTKAYMAFASYREAPYETIVTGHWGCRAFGGNREIKSLIQWSAASMASVRLDFVCDKVRYFAFTVDLSSHSIQSDSFALDFQSFTSQALSRGWTVYSVIEILRRMGPTDPERLSAFQTVRSVLNG